MPEVLAAYRVWTASVPEQLTSSVGLIPYPDLPMLPEPLRGRYVAHVRIAYTGSVATGERLVEPLRAVGPRLIDSLGELPFTESPSIYREWTLGRSPNFVFGERGGPEQVRDCYRAHDYRRLARLKAQYDPANLFRLNLNIPPAAS